MTGCQAHSEFRRACFAIASTEAGRDVVREGEAPAEPPCIAKLGQHASTRLGRSLALPRKGSC